MKGDIMDKSNKVCYSKIDKAKRGEPGDPIPFRLTERIVDRDGEVMEPMGAKLETYKKKNPIVLWSHNYGLTDQTRPAIGKIDVSSFVQTDEYLDADVIFDVENDSFARMIDGKYRDGFLNSGSIGFNPLIIGREPVLPKQTGATILKWELMEFSPCNIPSNMNATRKQYEEFFDECETFGKEYAVDRTKFFEDYSDMFKAKAKYNCECIDCGWETTTDKHCSDIKCNKCGGEMRRAERPGPGKTKAGAVLNANNRGAIKKAVDSIDNLKTSLDGLSGTLQKILETATPKPDDKNYKPDGVDDSTLAEDITSTDDSIIKQFNESIEKLQLIIKPMDMESFDTLAKVANMFNID